MFSGGGDFGQPGSPSGISPGLGMTSTNFPLSAQSGGASSIEAPKQGQGQGPESGLGNNNSVGPQTGLPPSAFVNENEFRDQTDQLKIRILDIVDQISGMHYERAMAEQERRSQMLALDNSKLNALAADSFAAVNAKNQENAALVAQLESAAKLVEELHQQLTAAHSTITELKNSEAKNKLDEGNKNALKTVAALKERLVRQVSILAPGVLKPEAKSLCSVCQTGKIDIVLKPCGHQVPLE